jgi:hypothetical protein
MKECGTRICWTGKDHAMTELRMNPAGVRAHPAAACEFAQSPVVVISLELITGRGNDSGLHDIGGNQARGWELSCFDSWDLHEIQTA